MARSILFKLAILAIALALAIAGVQVGPSIEDDTRLRQMMELYGAYWLATTCLMLAAALAASVLVQWICQFYYDRKLRAETRRATEGGNFRVTDGETVLNYISDQSVWGWKQYAYLNQWSFVRDHRGRELSRAAKNGDVRLKGSKRDQNLIEEINSGCWHHTNIESDVHATRGVQSEEIYVDTGASVFRTNDYEHISVATDDYLAEWPRASVGRRLIISIYVWLKVKALEIKWPKWVSWVAFRHIERQMQKRGEN